MHEFSLAKSLLRRVEAEAARAGLARVTAVEVEVGELQSVEPELLAEAFRAAAFGTRSAGAELRLAPVEGEARCLQCGELYRPRWGDFQCPACGLAEPQILRGHDLVLAALSGESEE